MTATNSSENSSVDIETSKDGVEHAKGRRAEKVLWAVALLSAVFIIAEFAGGFFASSLAIMTDAGHMLSDLLSFVISILAIRTARQPPSKRLSWGYERAEVLGALISIIILWVLTTVLVLLAIERIVSNNLSVEADVMLITACVGVGFNIIMGAVLHFGGGGHGHAHHGGHGHSHSHGGSDKNVNVRAAFIHVVGDLIQSIGVLIAALVIKFTGWELADPICTFFFSVIVLFTTITVLRDIFFVLMEATPRHMDFNAVREDLAALQNVQSVHDLHMWSLNMDKTALSVHLAVDSSDHALSTVTAARQLIRQKYGPCDSVAPVMRRDCTTPEIEVSELEKPSTGIVLTYLYAATSYLMRKMVHNVPDPTIQRIGKVIHDPKRIKTVILESTFENPIVSMILFMWILLAGTMVFLAGMNFVCRTLFVNKGKNVNALSMVWAALSFIVCVSTSLAGMYLFSVSLGQLQDGIQLLPSQLKIVTHDTNIFMIHLGNTVHCLYKNEHIEFNVKAKKVHKHLLEHVAVIENRVNITHMLEIFTQIQENKKTLSNTMSAMRKSPAQEIRIYSMQATEFLLETLQFMEMYNNWITGMLETCSSMLLRIKNGVKKTTKAKEMVERSMRDYAKKIQILVYFIRNSTIEVEEQLSDAFTEKKYSQRVSDILGYTIIIPFTLVALSMLGLTAIFIGCTFYISRYRHDEKRSRRGAVSLALGSILAAAGYTAILVGAMLCAMSAICFVIAFVAMCMCTGLFEDKELRLFHAIPNLEYTITVGNQEITHTVYDTFYKCKNGYTFFESLNGSEIMAEKEFRDKFGDLRRYDIGREIQNFHVSKTVVNTIAAQLEHKKAHMMEFQRILKEISRRNSSKDLSTLMENVAVANDDINELANDFVRLQQMIKPLVTPKIRDPLVKTIRKNQEQFQHLISTAIANLFVAIVDISPQCENLLNIWDGMGKYVCNWISAPAQGLWVASMFCAIGSVAIYHAFFNIARFMNKYAESTRDIYQRKRKRRDKFEYVMKALKEAKRSSSSSGSKEGYSQSTDQLQRKEENQSIGIKSNSNLSTKSRENTTSQQIAQKLMIIRTFRELRRKE
ncbi:hypothetical protein RB195_012294 [Necator americanus]|uniref:Cation diffusion facilitator family transporter n=1 Tax=Necator americanus TaxID=51031 RepID=A0ABR1D6I7_NECAM